MISVLFSSLAFGQAVTVFKGQPMVKISEGGVNRLPEQLSHNQAANFECVISEIDGRYYRASRENKELLRTMDNWELAEQRKSLKPIPPLE
jgi:hypothetical protein